MDSQDKIEEALKYYNRLTPKEKLDFQNYIGYEDD